MPNALVAVVHHFRFKQFKIMFVKVGEISHNIKSPNFIGAFFLIIISFISISNFQQCGFKHKKIEQISNLIREANSILDKNNPYEDVSYFGKLVLYNYYDKRINEVEYEAYYKYPEKLRINRSFGDVYISDAYDGISALQKIGNSNTQKINPKRFTTLLRIRKFPLMFLTENDKFLVKDNKIVDNDTCYVLEARYSAHETAKFYIDKNSGILRRYEGRNHTGYLGQLRIDFSHFEKTNGKLQAKRWIYFLNGRVYKIVNILSIQHNKGIDDIYFDLNNKAKFV
jgi:hypothetical protein